ncbi:MAG: hypothetical protein WKG00_32925 [Polyangiaceae bacterium]
MATRRRSFDTAPVRLVVLVVGVSDAFLERFRMAAAPRRADIIGCDEVNVRRTAQLRVPRTLLVAREAYERDRAAYETVASDVVARTVIVEREDLGDAEMDALVRDAVRWA